MTVFPDVTYATRRAMRANRGKDTRPEMMVRRALHAMGFRYRLHRRDLPGKPDIVFSSRRKAIFVHGCFWHQHDDPKCRGARSPGSRKDYWLPKLARNKERDAENLDRLSALGWRVLVIWECQLRDHELMSRILQEFMKSKELESS